MASRSISTIRPNDNAEPINVRLIRKWDFNIGFRNECNFLFVDKNGDAITAIGDARDKELYEAKLKLHSCYRITQYVTTKSRNTSNVVPHPAIIQLGRGTKFEQIDEADFPTNYFNFIPYEKLDERKFDTTHLSDFIGRLDIITQDKKTKADKRLLKFILEDMGERTVEIALWEEIANTIDKRALQHAPFPTVIAITSMRADKYKNTYQLQSTAATHLYINPPLQETTNITSMFTAKYNRNTIHLRNAITLAELLSYDPIENSETFFTCIASITSFSTQKKWFYKGCPACNSRLSQRGNDWTCINHPNETQTKFLFCVNATIVDATTSVTVTLFDEAVSALVQNQCNNFVTTKGYNDPLTIPEELEATKGHTKVFKLKFNGQHNLNKSQFVSNHIFTNSSTEFDAQPEDTGKESSSKTKSVAHGQKPTNKRDSIQPSGGDKTRQKKLKSKIL